MAANCFLNEDGRYIASNIQKWSEISKVSVLGHAWGGGECCWCHVLLQFGQLNLSPTCLGFGSKPQLFGDAGENRWAAASAQIGTQLQAASIAIRSATAEILLSLRVSFPSLLDRTVIPSCHVREVWGEKSRCQRFSPSPFKGIKGTALDAICTAGGKVRVSGFGCSSRTVYRVRAQNGKDSCWPGLGDTGGRCLEVFVRCFCHLFGSSYF